MHSRFKLGVNRKKKGPFIYNFLNEAFHLKVQIQDEGFIYKHCNLDLF